MPSKDEILAKLERNQEKIEQLIKSFEREYSLDFSRYYNGEASLSDISDKQIRQVLQNLIHRKQTFIEIKQDLLQRS